jgi:hypothetical protein
MSKKIKKINEFIEDDDARFDFNIDTRELTEEEKREKRDYYNKLIDKNLESFPKQTTPNFTLEEYREIIMGLEDYPNFTQDELGELDSDCMEMYGEPFFKKDDDEK